MDIKFGYIKDRHDERDFLYCFHPEFLEASVPLPTSVNLISECSPIENQLNLGSCVAHATAAVTEMVELKLLKTKTPGPEVFEAQFDPISRLFVYWNARKIGGDTSQDAGTTLRSAILALKGSGLCRETLWPYDPSQVSIEPPANAYSEASRHEESSGYRLDNTDISQLKQCLAQGFPFMFGIEVFQSFMSGAVAQNGMVPYPGPHEKILGGHALACVGYDDHIKMFLVRNSWGTGWGQKGYCQIPYSYLTSSKLASDFWTLRLT